MKVQLNRKESSYGKLPELHIAASEIVSDETFEQMQAHPLWDHDVIQKHIQDMRSVAGGEYCLLIAPENGTDGLLRGKFLCAVFRLHPRRAADDAGHTGAGAGIAQMRNSGQRGRAAGMHADADGKVDVFPCRTGRGVWSRAAGKQNTGGTFL